MIQLKISNKSTVYLPKNYSLKYVLNYIKMPSILKTQGYRFFFYSNDHPPPHIHVEKDNSTAKFLLYNVELVRSKRFNSKELKEIRLIIIENIELFKLKWDEYFTDK